MWRGKSPGEEGAGRGEVAEARVTEAQIPVGMLPHIHTSLKSRYLAPAEVAHTPAVYMSIQSIDLLNKHTVVFDSPFYLLGAFFFIASSIPQALRPSHLCWGLGAGHTGLVGCGRTGLLFPGQWGPPRGSVHT